MSPARSVQKSVVLRTRGCFPLGFLLVMLLPLGVVIPVKSFSSCVFPKCSLTSAGGSGSVRRFLETF